MNLRKTHACMLFLLLFFLPYAFLPLTSSQPINNGEISFQPNSIPLLNVYYEDHTFVFSYKTFYIRVAPFVIYNDVYYNLRDIIRFLRNNYPNINYTWLVDRAEKAVHYGFNLTRLPQAIADRIDYLGFRLVDLNFPLSYFKLETVTATPLDGDQYNITKIHVPKANLVFSFEDLYPYGYTVTHANSTYILIGNVKGKTDLYCDPITYSAPTITVVGGTSGSPYTFWDVWNASNVNGWNVVNNTCNTQYKLHCRLQIGDGENTTWFIDVERQITLSDSWVSSSGQKHIEVKAQANFRLGQVRSATYKTSYRGCSLITHSPTYWVYPIYSDPNSDVWIYSTRVQQTNLYVLNTIALRGDVTVWNIFVDSPTALRIGGTETQDLYNFQGFYNNQLFDSGGSIEKIFQVSSISAALMWDGNWPPFGNITMTDIYVRNVGGANLLMMVYGGNNKNCSLINCDSDTWSIGYSGSGNARVYRKYTFDLTVIFDNETAIQNANVTIYDNAVSVGSWLTNSTGQIATEILNTGFYNSTQAAIYTNNPFNLTITSGDYRYSTNFTLDRKTDWTITLTSGDILTPVNIGLIFIGCIVVFGVAAVIYERKR